MILFGPVPTTGRKKWKEALRMLGVHCACFRWCQTSQSSFNSKPTTARSMMTDEKNETCRCFSQLYSSGPYEAKRAWFDAVHSMEDGWVGSVVNAGFGWNNVAIGRSAL